MKRPLKKHFAGKKFRCIMADPPWPFNDTGSRFAAPNENCANGYEYMSIEEICALDVQRISSKHPKTILWLWSTWTHLLNGSAIKVANEWGFEPKTVVPWIKVNKGKSKASYVEHEAFELLLTAGLVLQIGGGHYARACSEPLIICVKNSHQIPNDRKLPGVIIAPRPSGHSSKPKASYKYIEKMCKGPRAELFARGKPRKNWEVWGDQVEISD